jgi:hypothetical protein
MVVIYVQDTAFIVEDGDELQWPVEPVDVPWSLNVRRRIGASQQRLCLFVIYWLGREVGVDAFGGETIDVAG